MAWKATFVKGVACFNTGDYEKALVHMNQAAEMEQGAFILYDSRAAVHERMGDLKAALHDSRRVIDLAPDRWQGYVRSARLFSQLGKYGSTIKMVDHALSRLQQEDVQRRTQLAELREKAAVAVAAAEKQRSLHLARSSYLLGKLPVETLVHIFTVLIDENHAWAIKLSHVCGHWRRILLNTPSAWQTLMLSKKRPLRKAKVWKQRAKNRIMRISFDMSLLDTTPVFAQLRGISWGHLRSLRISADAFAQLHDTLDNVSVRNTFSNLGELSLFHCGPADNLSRWLSNANWKLTTLHLSGSIYMEDGWWQRIQQLKELRLTGLVRRFSTHVFAANPSLERLVLDCSNIIDLDLDRRRNGARTVMHHLKHIECKNIDDPLAILHSVTAPSITHFSMSCVATTAERTLGYMAYRPCLVDLRITTCSLSPSSLLSALDAAPNLETLHVVNVNALANEVLQFLTPKTVDASHELPCRALQHLDVSYCSDLTTSNVYAFVKTRMQYASESVGSAKCAIVASLKVDGCPKMELEMLPWFRSKVARFSCVYTAKKDLKKSRRR